MLSWSYKVGFLGTILLWEICLNRTGVGVNATPVLNRQGGNVLVAAISAVSFLLPKWIYILRRSLWSRVRALPSLSILQLQLQTCHKRVPLRATWYWARLLLSNISWKIYNAPMKSFGQIDFVQNKKCNLPNSAQPAFSRLRSVILKTLGGARAAVRKLSKKLNF